MTSPRSEGLSAGQWRKALPLCRGRAELPSYSRRCHHPKSLGPQSRSLANPFARTEPMSHWLRVIAEWNPVSSLAQAMRELWGNGPPAPPSAQLSLHHPVLATVIWSLLLTAVFAPVALRAYPRRTADCRLPGGQLVL